MMTVNDCSFFPFFFTVTDRNKTEEDQEVKSENTREQKKIHGGIRYLLVVLVFGYHPNPATKK